MSAVYNESAPYPARWLRALSDGGHIAYGRVIDRSIVEVSAEDVCNASQFHAFAGVGVWSHALRLAGWPDGVPVWTGSCPCQPFSAAGRKKGFDDARHLWPEWFRLIRECRPSVVFGEQVASPDGLAWLDVVFSDLEASGYAVGASDLCAAGVGAPHLRQRLFFVAMAHAECGRGRKGWTSEEDRGETIESDRHGHARVVGNAHNVGAGRDGGGISGAQTKGDSSGGFARRLSDSAVFPGATRGFWSGAEWIYCADGKYRAVEPGTFPLAHGAPARVGRLRAYGNAIVAQVAATFIRAAMGVT